MTIDWQPIITDSLSGGALLVSILALWRTQRTNRRNDLRHFLEESEAIARVICNHMRAMVGHAGLVSPASNENLVVASQEFSKIAPKTLRWRREPVYPAWRAFNAEVQALMTDESIRGDEQRLVGALTRTADAGQRYVTAAHDALRHL